MTAHRLGNNLSILRLFVVLFLACEVRAQDETALQIHRSRDTGLATFITSKDGGPILAADEGGVASALSTPQQFLGQFGHLFGVDDPAQQLVADGGEQDLLGQTHSKFVQRHGGVPVFSGQLRIHQDAAGRVIAANGDFYRIPRNLEVRPSISLKEAIDRASREFEFERSRVNRAELTIVDPGWYGDPPLGPQLAYLVELEDAPSMLADAFFVSATTGKVIDQWSLNERLRRRQIHDGQDASDLPGPLVRSENQPAVEEPADVNRAFDYYGDTYDYFRRGFGRDSIDDNGLPMVATVNSTAPGCPNAFWSSTRLQMAFCTGTVTDDITAHELTHGLTFFTAQLIYQNQSGQLNESYSDVFGELVDLFNGNAAFALGENGANWPQHSTGPGLDELNSLRTECSPRTDYFDGVRWLMGEDSFAFGGAIRDLWNPTCSGDPDRALSSMQTCGPGDNGGVHSGSGIPNHAFAMLVDGKEFNGHKVLGIGPIKAGAVWYRALTTYLNPTSDFEDAYVALVQSAADLVGEYPLDPRTGFPSRELFTASDAMQVDTALQAVEMNGPGRCGWSIPLLVADVPPTCGDEVLIFSDDFESGAQGWTVSNSGPRTPYDWRLTNSALPYRRPGKAFVCEDKSIGDCLLLDESGSHELTSPPIELPASIQYPLLRFTHHVDVETGWDGGLVSVRVNEGRWTLLPASSFHFNPYNTTLRNEVQRNSNPFAGLQAWSGIGGHWGTSVVDLSSLATRGDTIEVRFAFGKDGCTGRLGWFVDDVEVFGCTDCNLNGISDDVDLTFRRSSDPLTLIGANSPKQYVLRAPPLAGGDVLLRVHALADLFGEQQDENLLVALNGSLLGEIFVIGARDCPTTPDLAELVVPREQYNAAVLSGDVTIDISATDSVDPLLCGRSSWVRVDFEYQTTTPDADADAIPDECQSCQAPSRPRAVDGQHPMNRYIAFWPSSSGFPVAHRVRRLISGGASINPNHSVMWVGPGAVAVQSEGMRVSFAEPQCSPHFSAQWDAGAPIYLSGDFIVPGATYIIDALEVGCATTQSPDALPRSIPVRPNRYSKPLTLTTASLWGDVTGPQESAAPDGVVDILDVSAVVDRFLLAPGAIDLHRADLGPADVDHLVDFVDVSQAVDAYRGVPFPFSATAFGCTRVP